MEKRTEEWGNGGIGEWKNGGTEERRNGGTEERRNGGTEETDERRKRGTEERNMPVSTITKVVRRGPRLPSVAIHTRGRVGVSVVCCLPRVALAWGSVGVVRSRLPCVAIARGRERVSGCVAHPVVSRIRGLRTAKHSLYE
jgi:hypothetical protein